MVKLGTGTLTLSGANTYTGGTTLSGGTLSLANPSAIGPSTIISFNGGTLQFTAANTVDYSPQFSTVDGQAYSIDTNGQSVTFGVPLDSNGGRLTKSGAGTLILTAASSFAGPTTINGGTLQLGDGVSVNGSVASNTIVNNGTLVFANPTQQTYGGFISRHGESGQDRTRNPGSLRDQQLRRLDDDQRRYRSACRFQRPSGQRRLALHVQQFRRDRFHRREQRHGCRRSDVRQYLPGQVDQLERHDSVRDRPL